MEKVWTVEEQQPATGRWVVSVHATKESAEAKLAEEPKDEVWFVEEYPVQP